MAFTPNAYAVTMALTASTATVTSVASDISAVTLAAARGTRMTYKVFNNSTQILYIKEGASASASDFTVKVLAGQLYEPMDVCRYTGILTGIWAAANGAALVTEETE